MVMRSDGEKQFDSTLVDQVDATATDANSYSAYCLFTNARHLRHRRFTDLLERFDRAFGRAANPYKGVGIARIFRITVLIDVDGVPNKAVVIVQAHLGLREEYVQSLMFGSEPVARIAPTTHAFAESFFNEQLRPATMSYRRYDVVLSATVHGVPFYRSPGTEPPQAMMKLFESGVLTLSEFNAIAMKWSYTHRLLHGVYRNCRDYGTQVDITPASTAVASGDDDDGCLFMPNTKPQSYDDAVLAEEGSSTKAAISSSEFNAVDVIVDKHDVSSTSSDDDSITPHHDVIDDGSNDVTMAYGDPLSAHPLQPKSGSRCREGHRRAEMQSVRHMYPTFEGTAAEWERKLRPPACVLCVVALRDAHGGRAVVWHMAHAFRVTRHGLIEFRLLGAPRSMSEIRRTPIRCRGGCVLIYNLNTFSAPYNMRRTCAL